jgi:FAD/FMN-containing dehydrogenase
MTIADALKSAVKGQVITAGDAEYDATRTVFYGGIDRHPAAIVRVADANDVAQVVSIARESEAELAIRAGGHSVAGHSASEGGIVLDVSPMKGLEFDLEARTAWAEAGLTAGEYTIAAAEHGLVTGFGDTASVGIAGLTLGGGVGYLVRKHGLTIDDLLAAEIVTADGEILQIDAENHPDLFWAIRGGGGNFGVVTRFKFRLHELVQVVGGILILPASPEILRGFVSASEAAPEELSSIVNIMVAPPMPFVPEEAHGKLVLFAMMVYAGDVANAEQVYAPFRALAEPIADMIRPIPYPEIYPPDQEDFHPLAVGRTLFIDALAQNEADVIFQYLDSSDAMMAVAQIRVLGGAMARVPADATAFAHRNRKIMANVAALFTNPDEAAQHEVWANDFMAALRQGEVGVYVNFLADEGEARLREAYPAETWKRLAAIKAQYDPTNFFHKNHNIAPGVE